MQRISILTLALGVLLTPAITNDSLADYARAGWVAVMQPGAHAAQGIATIIDEDTIQIDHFTYDGTAPLVYFYLGAVDSRPAFIAGEAIGPLLDRAYADESLTVSLKGGATLDGYNAISVWCAQFNANFSSDTFRQPGDANCDGEVNGLDVHAFALALTDAAAHDAAYPDCDALHADIDGDQAVTSADIEVFVAAVLAE